PSIPAPCEGRVARVAHAPGHEREELRGAPHAPEVLDDLQHRVRFLVVAGAVDQDDRLGILGGKAERSESLCAPFGLRGGKTEPPVAVAPDDESHPPVTEIAHAIEYYDHLWLPPPSPRGRSAIVPISNAPHTNIGTDKRAGQARRTPGEL